MADNLGPLAPLVGTWTGDRGVDVAPGADLTARPNEESGDGAQTGAETTPFHERIVFEPIGEVANHDQVLHGLRYSLQVWPIGDPESFHDEVGYWLWDASRQQVMRSFTVPRGYAILAGGPAQADARTFEVVATLGSETFGICSNPFLAQNFRTTRFDCQVELHTDGTFSYRQTTHILITSTGGARVGTRGDTLSANNTAPFRHVDSNHLTRVAG